MRPTPIASSAWQAIVRHGFADLSPPEAAHALLELPTNRPDYVGLVQEIGDWPARSPIGPRVPTEADIDRLSRLRGTWRAVLLLEDERALRVAATTFSRSFVLDPLYDSGEVLYAAWHDPAVSLQHAQRLATQASLLVRAGPMLRSEAAVLAPDHLPGSWDPRPGWRPRIPHVNPYVNAAWNLRTAFVLLYWADRLDAAVCTSDIRIARALRIALQPNRVEHPARVQLVELPGLEQCCAARAACADTIQPTWRLARRLTRSRTDDLILQLPCCLERIPGLLQAQGSPWTLILGPAEVADPALLIRRVLNGEDPGRAPPLPRRRLRRRPLCMLADESA